jgi:BirA family transcriptional regulator, biotin operon repressor / biotin---[acetyl-CoA-carboxylase] ligase
VDAFATDAVKPLLEGRFGQPFRFVPRAESTQDLLRPDDPEGAVAATDEQTAGRGRQGRRWVAPRGRAILCSVLLRPPPERRQPELSLVAGVAVADAVEETLMLSAQIKWPNDVLVNRKKVAGILAEARGDAIVLGIGVNVNQARGELPADVRPPAASLFTTDGVERAREPILARILARLEHHYDLWRDGGLDAIYVDLGSRDFLRGRRVSVDGVSGTAARIDRDGRLVIDVGGAERSIESGEVTYDA